MDSVRNFQSYGLQDDSQQLARMKRKQITRKRWKNDVDLERKFGVILKKALHESVEDAVHNFEELKQSSSSTLPDWMAIKIASVLVAKGSFERGKEILDSQYLMTGTDQRFARNASVDDHQILSALERILNESSTEAAASQYESAKLFFLSLLDMRFTSLKDVFLKCFMQFLVERDEIAKAIKDLNEFLSYGKSKSTSGAMFILLRAAYCSKDQHLIEQVKDSMKNWIKSNLRRVCLNGCVMLVEGKPIEFAEYLRKEEQSFGDDHLNYLCEFALHNKEPKIIESLIEIPELFKLDVKSRNKACEYLVVCYGKRKDLNGLMRIWKFVKAEKKVDAFAVSIQKLAHFFRCLNVTAPDDLVAVLRRFNE